MVEGSIALNQRLGSKNSRETVREPEGSERHILYLKSTSDILRHSTV